MFRYCFEREDRAVCVGVEGLLSEGNGSGTAAETISGVDTEGEALVLVTAGLRLKANLDFGEEMFRRPSKDDSKALSC